MNKLRTVLKFTVLALLLLAVLTAGLLLWLSQRQLLSADYPKQVATGGELEAKYAQYGAYEVAYFEQQVLESYEKYEIWYPAELTDTDLTYPVIVVNNGTGMRASRQKNAYKRLASWGFIVIATEEEYSWNGFSADMSLQYLLRANERSDSLFYRHIDTDRIGVTGHSQGGVACISAVTTAKYADRYRAAFLVSPTAEALAAALEWDYDLSGVTVPLAIFAGTGEVDAKTIIPLEGMTRMCERATSSPFVLMARKSGYDHGETDVQTCGYLTAWFLYYLRDDTEAGAAFLDENAELFRNPLYQDQRLFRHTPT